MLLLRVIPSGSWPCDGQLGSVSQTIRYFRLNDNLKASPLLKWRNCRRSMAQTQAQPPKYAVCVWGADEISYLLSHVANGTETFSSGCRWFLCFNVSLSSHCRAEGKDISVTALLGVPSVLSVPSVPSVPSVLSVLSVPNVWRRSASRSGRPSAYDSTE